MLIILSNMPSVMVCFVHHLFLFQSKRAELSNVVRSSAQFIGNWICKLHVSTIIQQCKVYHRLVKNTKKFTKEEIILPLMRSHRLVLQHGHSYQHPSIL